MSDIVSFVRKWNASQLTERSAAPQHFRDLCEALGVPHPTEEDGIGTSYTYEKRVAKTGGGQGFADVWKRGYFAWEYKSKGGDLKAAYKQLNEYHEALENPPLLVVCDFVRFEVHTKFENLPSRVYAFTLDDLLLARDTPTSAFPPLEVLRHLFGDFNQLRPGVAAARVTEAAASDFLRLARELELERSLQRERPSKEQIAHFLMRLVFCLFADSVELLPNHAFRKLVENQRQSPNTFNRILPVLFQAMSSEDSFFGVDTIPYFNGGLFTDNATIELNYADLGILHSASQHDWSHIEPAIFGTLFERSLDAAKRSMIGAHYTSTDDILLLIEPVVIAPLQRRWQTVQDSILAALAEESNGETIGYPEPSGSGLIARRKKGALAPEVRLADPKTTKRAINPALTFNRPALDLLRNWAAELSTVRILDPACGSGNFLYVALKRLLDLWHDARVFGLAHGLTLTLDPIPNPTQLFGIEIDFYAHEIASIVVWIGFLQWKHDHGVKDEKEPLLQKLTNIQHADAILRYDADNPSPDHPNGQPYEPTWPPADFIVGNPPFLGGKLLRRELGDTYIDDLFDVYKGRVKAESDLVVYWFDKAYHSVGIGAAKSAGLLATQSIRGGANRAVLERIVAGGPIFWAWSDRKWMLHGAAVHVSMIAFRRFQELRWPGPFNVSWPDAAEPYLLDGQTVDFINSALTSGTNTASALRLKENEDLCFMGTTKVGPFDIDAATARKMLSAPLNPNGRPNSDVVRPWVNALDITRRPRNMFIIDFGTNMTEQDAALYELPFEYLKHHVKSVRKRNARLTYARNWWIHGEARGDLRRAIQPLTRYILTPSVSKHRLFVWEPVTTLPDHANFAFAREDDYFFGVLHSSIHELWARAQGTQLREVESGFRYTPSSTFDTFPFPYPPGTEPAEADSPIVRAIADAARELVRLRDAWLNPPDISEAGLKDRTLTKLYNARPEWLANAHRTLDHAVFAAYGWPSTLTDQEILSHLLALNHQRASTQPPKS
ncbi:MAG: class I SAM-dependent DNA methyltransferase [Acidobacteria bacterium]|nr:class I SAM-dependent DNA methyltransferase [Acidobacteriota bacterium]